MSSPSSYLLTLWCHQGTFGSNLIWLLVSNHYRVTLLESENNCPGQRASLGSFGFHSFSLQSSALDHSATAPPPRWKVKARNKLFGKIIICRKMQRSSKSLFIVTTAPPWLPGKTIYAPLDIKLYSNEATLFFAKSVQIMSVTPQAAQQSKGKSVVLHHL